MKTNNGECILDLKYMHWDGLHPNKYGHQLIASFIINYIMKQYTKIKKEMLINRKDIKVWIDSHYLYGNNVIPQPLIKQSLIHINIPKKIHLDYVFDERLQIRNDHNGLLLFEWLSEIEQIKLLNDKIINQNFIYNIKYIQLFKKWNHGYDWKNIHKQYSYLWRLGFERLQYHKPGLIYILDENFHDIDSQNGFMIIIIELLHLSLILQSFL